MHGTIMDPTAGTFAGFIVEPIDVLTMDMEDIPPAASGDREPVVERAGVDDRVLTIPADRDLAVDVVAGGGRDAVAAVAGDRDPTVEVAATRDDDRTVAGADEISVDRTISGVVERLARPGHGVELNGGPAAVDRSRIGESTAASAVDYDARTAGARDLPVVVNPHGAGSIDAYHTLDDGPRVVVDLSASIQHDGVAAHVQLRTGEHVDRDVRAARLCDDRGRHRIWGVSVAGDGLPRRRGHGRRAGGAHGLDRRAECGCGKR